LVATREVVVWGLLLSGGCCLRRARWRLGCLSGACGATSIWTPDVLTLLLQYLAGVLAVVESFLAHARQLVEVPLAGAAATTTLCGVMP
jgi:hypothetical protein